MRKLKKGYQICELGYEYNDSGYDRPEGDLITPHRVCMDLERAEKIAKQLNGEKFREIRPTDYAESLDMLSSHTEEEIAELLLNVPGAIKILDGEGDLNKLKDADLEKVMEAFNLLIFFEVREVEIEDV